ncbi:hypothetical protein ACS0TY_017132 [Phlomoides rotata]
MGLGITIHDDQGDHIFNRTHIMPGLYEPDEGETIDLHETLLWIKKLELQHIIIEMGAKMVVEAVDSSRTIIFGFW